MSFFQDIRFGIRMLIKDPGFTSVVILTLALGIGANTTVFTMVYAVMFRGLPFDQPDRIMSLSSNNLSKRRDRMGVSYPDFADMRAQVKKLQGVAASSGQAVVLNDPGGVSERYSATRVSTNWFSLLGQKPILGRDFTRQEEQRNATPVVMLGYGVWKDRYGSDPNILGRVLRINDVATVVVGVMPKDMKFPGEADLWMPLIPTGIMENRDARGLSVIGRLAPGATIAEARTELGLLAKNLEKEYPKSNEGVGAVIVSFTEQANGGNIRTMFTALMGAVGFVLLIACANVANLLLTRSLSRAKEISIRTAMGASRLRVVRQLLIESVLLGVVGGVLGLPLAMWGLRAFDLAVTNSGKPSWIHFTMDYTVFGYLAAICVLTGILFGLAPALHISKLDVNKTLKEGGRSATGGSRMKYLSGVMVVIEVSLAIVLMAGAGLMIRSFLKMYGLDPGVDTKNLLTMRFSLPEQRYKTPESRLSFQQRLLPRLAAIPGVESVSLTSNVPLQGAEGRQFELEGQAPTDPEKLPRLFRLVITPEYFDTVRARIVRGRALDDSDGASGKPNIVVNQTFAAKFWPGEDPIGKRIRLTGGEGERPWLTVVGVSPEIIQLDPSRNEPNTLIYAPYRMDPLRGAAIIAHTRVPPDSLVEAFRKEVRNVDEDLPVFAAKSMEQVLIDQRWVFRVFGTLFAIFAGIGLALSAVGIYAVVAYSVTRRTQEIGVRMALGASAGSVLRLILSLGFKQLAIGLTLGLGAAYGLTRVLKSLLVQVTPTDPVTFAGISLLLLAIGGVACWMPARKAAKIDPMIALRYE